MQKQSFHTAMSGSGGFSMMSVLMAIAILSIGVGIMNRWMSQSARTVGVIKEKQSVEDMRMYVRGLLNCNATADRLPAMCRSNSAGTMVDIALYGHGSSPQAFVRPGGSTLAASTYRVKATCGGPGSSLGDIRVQFYSKTQQSWTDLFKDNLHPNCAKAID